MKLAKRLVMVSIVVMIMPMLSATYYVRVIGGYEYLLGRVVTIEGTVEDVLGVRNIWHARCAARHPVIQRYKEQNPPHDGVVYYGADGTDYYCFHETWFKVLPPKEAERELSTQDELVAWVSPDGTIFSTKDLVFCDTEKNDDEEKEDPDVLNLNKEDF